MTAAANSIVNKTRLTCIPFSVNENAIAHAIGFEAGLLSFEAGLLSFEAVLLDFVVRPPEFFPLRGR